MISEPFKATDQGRRALADVLVHIRDQAGCASWADFSAKAAVEAGLEIPEGTIKKYAPSPQYGSVPNPGLFYALGAWGIFSFSNGEPVTERTLYEVLLGIRSTAGDLLESRNGQPSP
ncbi:MAG: hypothetical protein AAF773_05165 [Cyanobacteria bacterium P01_D01_bin.115]